MKRRNKFVSVLLVCFFCLCTLFPVTAFGEMVSKWNSPHIKPPAGQHPRLMLTPQIIPTIRENLTKPQNLNAAKKMRELADQEITGEMTKIKGDGLGNIDTNVMASIEAKAFDYAVNGNEASGQTAVAAVKNVLKTAVYPTKGDYPRDIGIVIYVTSEVYDWCYPLLSSQDRQYFIGQCQNAAARTEVGWPPVNYGAVVGHGAEAQLQKDMLGFAIAVYDEAPDIYEFVAGRYFDEYVPARNYWYPAHSMHQGSGYNAVRYVFDLWSQWLIYQMSGQRVYVDDCQYVGYQFIYYTLPTQQLFREGDFTTETLGMIPPANTYNFRIGFLASGFYQDPYLKMEVARVSNGYDLFVYDFLWLTPVTFLIVNDPDLEPKSYQDLSTTKYFGEPNGLMVARTGWNFGVEAPDTVAMMKIGGLWMANHNHLDNGTFQIYYKGLLANDSGIYDSYGTKQDYNWDKETISHNGLLIYDPSEQTTDAVNSGGQRRPGPELLTIDAFLENDYQMAKVIGHEFGPNPHRPEYSYISGDLTKAYTDKVSEVIRSMMFMPTDDPEAPAVFFVMDKITSKKASFQKTFLLHSLQEPEVEGNVTTIKRDTDGYNGKLTVQTLYPENPKITKIGGEGKQWYINGVNYQPNKGTAEMMDEDMSYGWGRVEISPSEKQKTDFFLNAMYVSDADGTAALNQAEPIEVEGMLGAKLLDKAVLFNPEQKRISDAIFFSLEGEEDGYDVAVCGLQPGEWSILLNGREEDSQIATEEGGMIYFHGAPGNYILRLKDADAQREVTPVESKEYENLYVKVGKDFLYSDVPPTIRDGRTLIPMRAVFEKFGAELAWDDATATATVSRNGKEIKITQGSKTVFVDGSPVELEVPAETVNGRFMVPVRFVAEAFGSTVSWEEFGRVVQISLPQDAQGANLIPVANAVWSSASADDKGGDKAVDGDYDTRWAADGVGESLVIEFENVEKVSSFATIFGDPLSRYYNFELYASTDGKNYAKFFEGRSTQKASQDLFELEESVEAKYVKFVAKGGSYTNWVLLHEIEFYR